MYDRLGTIIIDEIRFAIISMWLADGAIYTRSRAESRTRDVTISDQPTMVLLDRYGIEVSRWRSRMEGWTMTPGVNFEFTHRLSINIYGLTGVGGFG